MKRLAIAFCLACSAASAAIVSEENDLYTVVPWFSALYGSPSKPGIRSPFIPYGTYTDGSGSAEYLRVSTNLLGVLYSTVDGYWERYHIPLGVRPVDMPSYTRYYPTTDTNETRRIIDILNATNYVYRTGLYDEDYAYHVVRGAGTLEYRLAHAGSARHEGLAAGFSGRHLDELTGNAQPPIATEWSTTYPFLASASNAWRNVFPTYAGLSCDDHFWPSNEYGNVHTFARGWEDQWMYPSHLADVWANGWSYSDLRDEAESLRDIMLDTPLTNVIEDVLGVDTGWMYPVPVTNDYWIVTGPYIGSVRCERSGGSWASEEDSRVWYGSIANSNYNASVLVTYYGDTKWIFMVYGNAADGTRIDASATVDYDGTLASWTFDGYTATKVSLYDGEDVYSHWRNGTRRLDWTRLGITCQLERQMESTYKAREAEDYAIAMTNVVKTKTTEYETDDVVLTFVTTNGPTGVEGAYLLTDLSGFTYHEVSNVVVSSGHEEPRCFPTARGSVSGNGNVGCLVVCPVYTSLTTLESFVLEAAYLGITNVSIVCELGQLVESTHGIYDVGITASVYLVYDFGANRTRRDLDGMTKSLSLLGNGDNWSFSTKVGKSITKSGSIHYTAFDGTVVSNLTWESGVWPETNIWSGRWVAQVSVPNVDFMVAYSNDISVINGDASPMVWTELHTNDAERVFRYDTLSPRISLSRSAVGSLRTESLENLNSEVAAKFAALAGAAPAAFAGARIADNTDINALLLASTNISTTVAFSVPERISLRAISQEVDGEWSVNISEVQIKENDVWSRVTPVIIDGEKNYAVGALSFVVAGSVTATNECYRVDGHQNQLIKTLWRFRNLRDPDL